MGNDFPLIRLRPKSFEKRDHLRKRKELWEARQANSGKSLSTIRGPGMPRGFAEETAEATGKWKISFHFR